MTAQPAYRSELALHAGLLEQSFRANFVVVEAAESGWLIAFGDLLGDDALGNMRPPIHSLLVHVEHEPESSLSIEFNDQGNTRDESDLERFDLARESLRIWVKPGAELWSGRVSYERSADPFSPDQDPEPQPIRGVHVSFSYVESTYEAITKALGAFRADWLRVAP